VVAYRLASVDPRTDCPLEEPVCLDGPSWGNLQVFDVPECDI